MNANVYLRTGHGAAWQSFATLDDFLEVIDARPERETVRGKNAIRLELYQEQV